MAKKIEPDPKLIGEYLKLDKNYKFVIPEYQREYSWNITHCEKLWQDVEEFIKIGPDEPYFFGTIILSCDDDKKTFSLIDGQQRTTTFLLILKAILIGINSSIPKVENDEDSEGLLAGLKARRNSILKILYLKEDEEIPIILKDFSEVKNTTILENNSINEDHKEEMRKILESVNFDIAKESVYKERKKHLDNKYTNYFRNYKYFYNKLLEKSESELNKFAKVFLDKCQVIRIKSWDIDEAIKMFNSLNSTGMPLSDANIISAELYSKSGADKEVFKEKWEEIINLTKELDNQKVVDIDAVLQQFMYLNRAKERAYLTDSYTVTVTTPGLRRYYTDIDKELLNKPLVLCENLIKIAQIWDEIKGYSIVKLLLKFNENVKLYLPGYLYRYEPEKINQKNVLEISECLLRLFTLLELVDTGYSSSKFKTFLFRENLKLVDEDIKIEIIKEDFNEHIKKNWKEEEIVESIQEYDKNILVFLNEYLYDKSHSRNFDFMENVNVEHIMPASGRDFSTIRRNAGITDKNEFKSIVNKLGNKILLEEKINKALGNAWFKTKKQNSVNDKSGYKDSKYGIASALTNYPKDTWDINDIDNATKKVVVRIIKFVFNK